MKNANKIVVRPEGKKPLDDLGADGMIILRRILEK
jgi:hypothetical protein